MTQIDWGRIGIEANPWQATVEEAVVIVVKRRAGRGPLARFAAGEMARLAGITEDEAHETIEELSKAYVFGAESNPTAVVVIPNLPEYQEPPLPALPTPADKRIVTVARRNGKWSSRLVPVDSKVVGIGAKVGTKDGWEDDE